MRIFAKRQGEQFLPLPFSIPCWHRRRILYYRPLLPRAKECRNPQKQHIVNTGSPVRMRAREAERKSRGDGRHAAQSSFALDMLFSLIYSDYSLRPLHEIRGDRRVRTSCNFDIKTGILRRIKWELRRWSYIYIVWESNTFFTHMYHIFSGCNVPYINLELKLN